MLNKAVAESEIPGAVALVARHGKIVYLKAFGMADNTSSKKLNTDAIFRIASQSKAITTTAVMMLWEEGKFKLDDPISKYIPEFKNPQVLDSLYPDGKYTTKAAKREITIRDLITHTSGILGTVKLIVIPVLQKYIKMQVLPIYLPPKKLQ